MYNDTNDQNGYNQNKEPQEYYYSTGSNYNNSSNSGSSPRKPKKQHPFAKKAVSFVCLGALFGVTAGAAFSVPTYMTNKQLLETKSQLEASQTTETTAETQTEAAATTPSLSTTTSSLTTSSTENSSADVAAIAESCLPSVVSITNKGVSEVQTMFGTYQQDTESSGSGIIIGENDTELLIVTNYHVVSGSSELSVVFSYDEDSDDPSVVAAKLKGYDSDKDLAVISVSLEDVTDEMKSQIKVATIGDSSSLQLGQEVVAIGNALGYGQSVTSGIISALDREVSVSNDDGSTITNKYIQTDAAINPGNSGGALLNMNGELIGINSVKVSSSSVEGMGYAIPISDVQSIIEELMLKETRDVVDESEQGYIGIGGTDVTSEISSTYGMPQGIYINTIYDNSPALTAGLSKGYIITKFDGQSVKSMSELKTLLTYYKAGETVDVVAMVPSSDGYTEQTFSLTLTSKSVFGDDATSSDSQDNSSQDGDSSQENGNSDNYNYFFWPFSQNP